jgi:hypothetical protein
MSRHDLLAAVCSTVIGWVALFAVMFSIERPLLRWTAPILGPSWFPTAQLALECCGLAVVGWLIGRWGKPGVLIFAATLALPNFGQIPSIDVPWLVHLFLDCLQNARYLESFLTSLATQTFLFASVFIGANLSRARHQVELSIK